MAKQSKAKQAVELDRLAEKALTVKDGKPVSDANYIVIPDDLGDCPDDKILILPDEAMEMTPSGIIIPQTAQDAPQTGIVISVGDRLDGKPSKYTKGDRIYYGKYSGVELSIKATQYLLMSYRDVLWNFKQ